jgi:hypothetical protein
MLPAGNITDESCEVMYTDWVVSEITRTEFAAEQKITTELLDYIINRGRTVSVKKEMYAQI